MAGEIFICYRRSDKAKAQLLHKLLRRRGVDAWYDALLGAGENWREKTAEALAAAPIFVLLFSKAASESDDISKELAAATFSKKMVIPVRIENIVPTGAFLYELASRNWFDAYEDTDMKLADLADKLAALVKGGAKAHAAAADLGAPAPHPNIADAKKPLLKHPVVLAGMSALACAVLVGVLLLARQPAAPVESAGNDRVAFFGFAASGDDPGLKDIAHRATDEAFANLGVRRIDTAARGEAVVPAGQSRLDRAAELEARFALSGEVRRDGDNNVFAIRIENVASRATLLEFTISQPVTAPVFIGFLAADGAVSVTSCIVTTAYTDDAAPRDAEALAIVASGCRAAVNTSRSVQFYRELVEKKIGGPDADGWLANQLSFVLAASPPAVRAGLLDEAEQALTRASRKAPDSFTTAAARARLAIKTGAPPATWIPAVEAAMRRHPKPRENYAYSWLSLTATNAMLAAGRIKDALAYAKAGRDADPLSYGSRTQYITLLGLTGPTVAGDFVGWDVQALKSLKERPAAPLWEYTLTRMIFSGQGDVQALLDLDPLPKEAEPYIVDCYRNLWPAMRLTAAADRRAAMKRAEPCLLKWDSSHIIVEAASILGDLDMAFAQLDTVEKVNHNAFTWLPAWFMPGARALRADPRFLPLMEKLGYVDYWKQTGTKPDVCVTPEERDIPLCVALR